MKTKRKIDLLILHCAATPESKHFTVEQIDKWHKQRGWSGIGYHFVIYLDGSVHKGRSIDKIGAHTIGKNTNSIGVCYIGGCNADMRAKDTRTPEQIEARKQLCIEAIKEYPSIKIAGHNDFANKACPSFDVGKWLESIQIPKENIYL